MIAWNPGIAVLLSLVIPGLGQVYKGQIGRGILWFFAVLIGYVALIVPGIILHIWCMVNAATSGRNQLMPVGVSAATHVKCPECREPVFRDAIKCKHCGATLIPNTEPVQSALTANTDAKLIAAGYALAPTPQVKFVRFIDKLITYLVVGIGIAFAIIAALYYLFVQPK